MNMYKMILCTALITSEVGLQYWTVNKKLKFVLKWIVVIDYLILTFYITGKSFKNCMVPTRLFTLKIWNYL